MQDLDFEELDKAVNSLMPQSASDNTAVQPSNNNPVTNPVVAPIANTVERPATGRFMDVVHPSSDMRSSLNMPQRTAAPVISAPDPIPAPRPIPTAPVINTPVQNTNNWAGLPNYPVNKEVPDSPFLTEAKVEKRPLGAFSDEINSAPQPAEAVVPDKDALLEVDPNYSQKPIVPETSAAPAELDDLLLKVEPDSSTHPNAIDPSINPLSQNPMSESINQQYAEKPNVVSAETGNIYNASTYSKVVAKKSAKKSGWMWVLWIILLLIIGAGAGVAFYFFVVPSLPGFKLPF